MKWAKINKGFTIVELLIVVVVIAILAAITIVAYNGITNRSKESQAQSTLSQSMKKIKTFAVANGLGSYPTSISACPAPGANELCLTSGVAGTVSYAFENSSSPQSFCMSVTQGSIRYYIDDAGTVKPGSCELRSCYEIQQQGGSRGSGTYWIRPTGAPASIRAYCDMETSGGGWTLLVNNVGQPSVWTASTVYNLNAATPSLSTSYSVVQYADDIKANLSGRLNYRLDANQLGQLGGVWDAPYTATLEGTAAQEVATLVTKYETPAWTFDSDPSNGTSAPSTIVPWYSSAHTGLVTWGNTGNWWGAIMTNQTGWTPTAPYISTIGNPTAIRYWVK